MSLEFRSEDRLVIFKIAVTTTWSCWWCYDGDVNKVEEKKDVLGDNDDDDEDFDNKLVSTRMLHIEPVGHEGRDARG